jgi:hypothetical protein
LKNKRQVPAHNRQIKFRAHIAGVLTFYRHVILISFVNKPLKYEMNIIRKSSVAAASSAL